jgi:hypothetical protein
VSILDDDYDKENGDDDVDDDSNIIIDRMDYYDDMQLIDSTTSKISATKRISTLVPLILAPVVITFTTTMEPW